MAAVNDVAAPKTDGQPQSEAPLFFDNSTFSDVMSSGGKAPAVETEEKTGESEDPEADKPDDEKLPKKQAPPKSVTPAAPDESEPADGETADGDVAPDPYEGIINKYGGDPAKMAKAIANLQKGYTQKSQLVKRLLGSQSRIADTPHAEPAPTATESLPASDDEEISEKTLQEISELLTSNPQEGLKRFLKESKRSGAEAVAKYEATRRKQEAEAQRQQVEKENLRVISERAREILLERAHESGETADIKRYSNKRYQVTEDEYLDAYDQLAIEVDYINEYFQPKGGRITPQLFNAARFGIDPENYDEKNRLIRAHEVVTSEDDGEVDDYAPLPPTRKQRKSPVVLSPKAATHKASAKFDVSKFDGTRTDFQEKVWTMSDAELDAIERQLKAKPSNRR